ncbi:hypothetical protein Tco_0049207, partial [Tanacetum coccineum]
MGFAIGSTIRALETRIDVAMAHSLWAWFRAKLVSSHRLSIFSKWVRHVEKELPKTEKSSINTSIVFSIMSWKIAIIHLWNVPGALQRPKGMRR